jgi:L-fucose mutarotase
VLNGIHPLLTGPLLAALDSMGHSDAVLICDAHFPAARLVRHVVEVPGTAAPEVAGAICTLLPLDDAPGVLMDPGPGSFPVIDQIRLACGGGARDFLLVSREEFYRLAATAVLAVRTGEARPFGNVLLRKGLVEPSALPRLGAGARRLPAG